MPPADAEGPAQRREQPRRRKTIQMVAVTRAEQVAQVVELIHLLLHTSAVCSVMFVRRSPPTAVCW